MIGFIGLGRMGLRMASRITNKHNIIAYDLDPKARKKAREQGIETVDGLSELPSQLAPRRIVWMMVPAGAPVEDVIDSIVDGLEQGDIIIDGGNSHYKDSVKRAEVLAGKGIFYLDVGTSGGLEGAEKGASLTVGGPIEAYEAALPLLETIALPGAILHCGPAGAGHYVKMVHNGVEYAMLQAIGEGFEMLHSGPYQPDLAKVAEIWNNGCVIRSWMLELAARAFTADPSLDSLRGVVGGGETGRWMVETAMKEEIPTPIIALSLLTRFRSKQEDTFSGKVVAAIRREFGGHPVKLSE